LAKRRRFRIRLAGNRIDDLMDKRPDARAAAAIRPCAAATQGFIVSRQRLKLPV
jgi:hypothetical protein